MTNRKNFQPKFVSDFGRWKKLIDHLRKIGIKESEKMSTSYAVNQHENQSLLDETKKDSRTIISKSYTIKTLDDLLTHCQVDLEKYVVESFTVNKWEVAANIDNELKVQPLFQVKARLKPIVIVESVTDVVKRFHESFLDDVSKIKTKHVTHVVNRKATKLLEPFICDLHIGKLAFDEQGVVVWNLDKAVQMYDDIISDILSRVDPKSIQRILLPVGNDLVNIDNGFNTTTKGTPQMTGDVFHKIISDTEILLIRNIEKLLKIAPVDILCIPGNHDNMSTYHIGRTVNAYFHNNKGVTVVNSHESRLYYQFKKIMIGLTHGNNEKLNELPSLASFERPGIWGKTTHREFHVGHFHHLQTKVFQAKQLEHHLKGMTVRICPTVCPSDLWHKTKGFTGNFQRTQTFVFSPEHLDDIIYTNV